MDLSKLIGLTYTTAARRIWDAGTHTAYRVMDGELPTAPPRSSDRAWLLLWMDDEDAINPTVTAAEFDKEH